MGDDERHPSSPGRCHKQGSGLRTRSGMSPLRNRRPRGVTGSTLGSGAPASSIFTLWAQRMPRAGPGWAPFSRARAVGLWQLSACSFRAAICPVSIMGFPGPAWDAGRALGPQPGLQPHLLLHLHSPYGMARKYRRLYKSTRGLARVGTWSAHTHFPSPGSGYTAAQPRPPRTSLGVEGWGRLGQLV